MLGFVRLERLERTNRGAQKDAREKDARERDAERRALFAKGTLSEPGESGRMVDQSGFSTRVVDQRVAN